MKSSASLSSARPAPPRRSPRRTRPAPLAPAAKSVDPDHEQCVREAAYFLYERSGRVAGRELEHWLEAEALLLRGPTQATQRDADAD